MSSGLRAGITVMYWPWFSFEEQVRLARLADELGLDSVWTAEAWGQDAVSMLGYLSAVTQRIGLGSGLMQMPARKPTATAMAAASLDVLSGGRLRLGLGPSGPQVSEGWYGVPFGKPLARTREYVDLVRRALAGEKLQLPLENDGAGATGLGKPLKLLARPVQERIPIYLGAIGPKTIGLAGEIGDGWSPFMLHPEQPEVLLDPLWAGLERAGRTREEIDVAPGVPVALHEDIDQARDLVRPWLTFYFGAMGAKDKNFYVDVAERYGYGEVAREVQSRFLAGDRVGAATALPASLIDAVAIATTPAGLDDRLAAYERIGVNTIIALPCGDREGVVRALAAATA
jgi:F420-dependent oxidoreductase-like protein